MSPPRPSAASVLWTAPRGLALTSHTLRPRHTHAVCLRSAAHRCMHRMAVCGEVSAERGADAWRGRYVTVLGVWVPRSEYKREVQTLLMRDMMNTGMSPLTPQEMALAVDGKKFEKREPRKGRAERNVTTPHPSPPCPLAHCQRLSLLAAQGSTASVSQPPQAEPCTCGCRTTGG